MQQRLARLDSARKDFIANASHELRTPIFSLGGFVELLDEEEPDPAARKEFVRTMREQVARLTKLTADLLDLSKLDADAIEFNAEPVDLGELARRVAASSGRQPSGTGPRSRSTATGPPRRGRRRPGRADHAYPARQRAHAHAGGNLDLDHSRSARTGPRAWWSATTAPASIRSAGARVFDRFYTGDRVSGSGLGLAIARELTLRMGGELALASRRGLTEFTLRLPAAGAEGAPA